jgi:hypothetical protein
MIHTGIRQNYIRLTDHPLTWKEHDMQTVIFEERRDQIHRKG